MPGPAQSREALRLDERNHVEKPLLDQLAGLGWEVIDLTDMKQNPADTHRESFTEVVMVPVLRERLKVINPWLEDDQVEETSSSNSPRASRAPACWRTTSTCSSSCWRTPASARIVRAARRARPSASWTYFITSLGEVKLFQQSVRSHWGIENALHWRLDVTFREDESRIRRGNAPHNIGVIRHVAMNLLKREKTKISYRKKRIRAALNDAFRDNLLMGQ